MPQTPNMARFRVYNCAPKTIAALRQKEYTKLKFFAGYLGNPGLVYAGNIKQTIAGHETAVDSYVDLFCGDGEDGYNFAHTKKTLAAGYSHQDIFDAALASLAPFGITKGLLNIDLATQKFPRGRPLFEMTRDILRTIAQSNGALWSIQNGQVHMLDPKKALTSGPFVMNSSTGMIGWPRQTENGIYVTSLINPRLQVDSLVQINEKSIIGAERDVNSNTGGDGEAGERNLNISNTGRIAADGIYKVYYIERSGDSRGQDWYDNSCVLANGSDGAAPASPNGSQIQTGYYPVVTP